MPVQKLKITMTKIFVKDNGESPGKGELYWSLSVDGTQLAQLSPDAPRKTGDGETIVLGNSTTVTKAAGATLTVLGNVNEKDSFLKGADDSASFSHVYTAADNWGIGSKTAHLQDGKHLDVTVYYSIAKA